MTAPKTAHQKADAIRARKASQGKGSRLTALTAYDYPTARLLDEAGIDILLVGDSLGMVVLGFPDTTLVTLEHMLHHTAAAARGNKNALLLGDLPINTYHTPAQALETAQALVQVGAEAVKLEGGLKQLEKVKAIVTSGIPVIGHLGMLPQRVLEEGGYKKKGKNDAEIEALIEGAQALEKAGISALVLESVLPEVAAQVTQAIQIPTIGIGCERTQLADDNGEPATFQHTCDGEVAVITDLLGSYPWFVPPFAIPEAQIATNTQSAAQAYRQRIQG